MIQEAERAQDDPALHEGRLRSFSHCANSWASYVYVGMEVSQETESIVALKV